ncbi:MAG: caspase family protein [Tenuifilaceae bacterium]
MKNIVLIASIIIGSMFANGQETKKISGKSTVKRITFKQDVNTVSLRQLPDLIINNKQFSDNTKNNIIDAQESSTINFTLENIGKGEARGVTIKVLATGNPIGGLKYDQVKSIGTIYPTQKIDVKLPITSGMDIIDGKVTFRVEVVEEKGFDANPFEFEIETMAFKAPDVVVADHVFSTDLGGKIKPTTAVNLKVLVQNVGQGDARNVTATFVFIQQNCLMLSETDKFTLGDLKRGESRELDFQFTTNKRYTASEIPVKVYLKEEYGKYGKEKLMAVNLEQELKSTEQVAIAAIKQESGQVTVASIYAETDKNIPITAEKFANRYALIIGNEDYTRFQTGLNTESNVAFAINDAKVFAEYALKTLGVKEENLFLLTNSTKAEMSQRIELITKLLTKVGPDAELIFYYAGHGLPDEETKVAYLIPVDVSGTNPKAGILLSDVYQQFAQTGAKRIAIFLDACFTGGGRQAGLIAARGVKVRPKNQIISGNMVVLTATTGEQSALPYNDKQHGMFTYYLLKKLQETKGDIKYGELSDYLQKEVSLQSLKLNYKDQDPQVNVSSDVMETWKDWALK